MKYYSVNFKGLKLKRDAKKELLGSLTALDKAVLKSAEHGNHITGLLRSGKPFVNKFGVREFASTNSIVNAIGKLEKLKLLERR